jgi:hypothetical protein
MGSIAYKLALVAAGLADAMPALGTLVRLGHFAAKPWPEKQAVRAVFSIMIRRIKVRLSQAPKLHADSTIARQDRDSECASHGTHIAR